VRQQTLGSRCVRRRQCQTCQRLLPSPVDLLETLHNTTQNNCYDLQMAFTHYILSRQHPAHVDSDCRQLRSAAVRNVMHRSMYEQPQRQKLHSRWPAHVEQSSGSTATRHELFAVQASTENISVRKLVDHRTL